MTVASYGAETAAITGYLKAGWDSDAIPVAWPNTPLGKADEGKLHMELHVGHQEAFNADISTSRRVRHPGLVTAVIRAPLGTGDGKAVKAGDDLCALLRNLDLDGIHFRAPTLRDFGRDGDMYRVEVSAPYYRDSIF